MVAIKPRFLLINQLDEAVQYHGVQMKEVRGRASTLPAARHAQPSPPPTAEPALASLLPARRAPRQGLAGAGRPEEGAPAAAAAPPHESRQELVTVLEAVEVHHTAP